jgi:hypothetical protein
MSLLSSTWMFENHARFMAVIFLHKYNAFFAQLLDTREEIKPNRFCEPLRFWQGVGYRQDKERLKHIREAFDNILKFTEGRTYEDFEANVMLRTLCFTIL